MKKINIGLDLGIASVGWSVVDIENLKILNAGSFLFEEAGTGGGGSTKDRREHRGRRRLLRRKNLRKKDTINLFVKYGLINKFEDFYDIDFSIDYLKTRKKALSEKITKNELMAILFNYIKHRGSFNFKDDLIEDKDVEKEDISIVDKADKIDYFAVDKQIEFYANYGQYRGLKEKESLLPNISYLNEIEQILSVQIEKNVILEDFKTEYLKIFTRKRSYYEGPGKGSEYGWEGDEVFFDRLAGKDKFSMGNKDFEEIRAPKHSLTSYLFNILNDLNNLKFKNQRGLLNEDQKRKLIEETINSGIKTKNITLKSIAKMFNFEENDISGYRVDKDGKSEFTKFESINKIRAILVKNNLDYSFIKLENLELLDDITTILTKYQSSEDRKIYLEKLNSIYLSDEHCEKISLLKFSGTHKLSKKRMNMVIEEMWAENKNHMEVYKELKIKESYGIRLNKENFKWMPVLKKAIDEIYVSPVVKRTFINALRIIKELEIEYKEYQINDIVVELAREKNSEEQRKYLSSIQNNNQKLKKMMEEEYGVQFGDPSKRNKSKGISNKFMKFLLLYQQDGKCAYSREKIDIDRLKQDDNYCEIDHIIPYSISFDDSIENKVLCLREENQAKKNDSPYAYFKRIGRNWEDYKSFIISNIGKHKEKRMKVKMWNLLNEDDINSLKYQKNFISRNLNDTRYSTIELLSYLKNINKELEKGWKIKNINGRFTSYLRSKVFNLEKNRDNYEHHAVDATLVAISPFILKLNDKGIDLTNDFIDEKVEQQDERAASLDLNKFKKDYVGDLRNQILSFDYKFNKKVKKISNTTISNETIYTGRRIGDQVVKISSFELVDADDKTLEKLFVNNPEKLLIYESDPKTFAYLRDIYNEYNGRLYKNENGKCVKMNPFNHFKIDNNSEILKQSNEINPPKIKKLRYKDNNVSSFIDISHKYRDVKKNKVIFLTGSNWLRLDLWYSKIIDKYKVIYVDNKNQKFSNNNSKYDLNSENYIKSKKELAIDESYEFKYSIFKNDELCFNYNGENKSYIVTGFRKSQQLFEFKFINKKTEKRIFIAIGQMKNIAKITANFTTTKIKKI